MARQKRKKRNQAAEIVARFTRPTNEREAHNDFQSAGAAVRVVPVIDTLLKAHRITRQQYDALAYYRELAHRAEDDMAQASPIAPERAMGGCSGSSHDRMPRVFLSTPAVAECSRIERDLGHLRPLTRAIAVDDITPAQWAIETSGGIERTEGGRTVIRPKDRNAVNFAVIELQFAAGYIVR